MKNQTFLEKQIIINIVKPGDTLEIEPDDRLPNFDKRIKVNEVLDNGFLYGLSSTCDGYFYPFYAIKNIKIV